MIYWQPKEETLHTKVSEVARSYSSHKANEREGESIAKIRNQTKGKAKPDLTPKGQLPSHFKGHIWGDSEPHLQARPFGHSQQGSPSAEKMRVSFSEACNHIFPDERHKK